MLLRLCAGILALAAIASTSSHPYCSLYFGQPQAEACVELLFEPPGPDNPGGLNYIDDNSHLFSLFPGLRAQPPGVEYDQWKIERFLPMFRTNGVYIRLMAIVGAIASGLVVLILRCPSSEGCKLIVMPILYNNGSVSYDTATYKTIAAAGVFVYLDCIAPVSLYGIPAIARGGWVTTGESHDTVVGCNSN